MDVIYLILKLNKSKKIKMQFIIALIVFNVICLFG